jgi:hypothetical protein
MANDRKSRLKPPAEPSAYEVGYGKPPIASRFAPGQSGNPKGRPKGSRNKALGPTEGRLRAIILAEAYRSIKVNEGKKQISIPMAEAIVRALAVNAARGQLRSQQAFTKMLAEAERALGQQMKQWLETALNYKLDWEDELDRRKKLGLTGPEPIPHPDDVHVNVRTGEVSIIGPMTRQEKAALDHLYDRVEEADRNIEHLSAQKEKIRSKMMREYVETEIAHERFLREKIVSKIGEPSKRRRS